MARIFDEKFEGTGYEETWSGGETVAGGCTLNEDYATSGLSGVPSTWNNQCLQVISDTTGDEVYVGHTFGSALPIAYYRIEVYCHTATITNYNMMTVLRLLNNGYGACFDLGISNQGGTYKWEIDVFGDTTPSYYATFAFDTFYRIEIKWDNTNNAFEWLINGVSQNTLAFTNNSSTQRISLGARNHVTELYLDNFAVDDSDWVGAEGGGGKVPLIMGYMNQMAGGVRH